MRRWRARADAGPGALFSFLAAGKKSVVHDGSAEEVTSLLAGADIVITSHDGRWGPSDLAAAVSASAVVVVISPFGDSGPYVDMNLSTNEFLLQAMCGSIGGRGWPESEPVQAGGRLGEWFAGSFAAVAAAASVRRARRTGVGEIIDLSVYEAMAIAMGSLGAVSASVLGGDAFGTRSLELPSIVPTADGLVGFCTITAQQFQDFLVLIERPDLLADEELATMPGRIARREEFLAMVHDWAGGRTTAEIVESAAAFRIPVSPIATPTTITSIDHYDERGVFVESADGAVAPRVPYRSSAISVRPPAAAPGIGADNGRVHWPAVAAEPVQSPGQLPLAGIRIVDLTAFWAGPMATQVLAALGADVIKVEGVRRPDGMRFAGGRPPSWDRWWEWGPVFQCSNTNKRGITLELSTSRGREVALDLIRRSDIVIENFSPRVLANFDLEWDVVHDAAPQVTMLRMPAFGLDGPWRDRVGFAQTMEQASGMAWMTGSRDGPPIIPRGLCDPLAGLHASFAAIAALEIRDRTGAGIHVESTMVEAALNVAAEPLLEYSRNGVELHREGNRGPGASPQGVYRCSGDDEWVALAITDERAWKNLAEVIGHSELAEDETLRDEWARRRRADEVDKFIEEWTSQQNPADVIATLHEHLIPSAYVVGAADLLEDEHLMARGFWETVDHPVVGTFKTTGMPFTFAGHHRKWVTTPAPLYGQHTDEVLRDILGCTPADIASLEEVGAVARRPAGL